MDDQSARSEGGTLLPSADEVDWWGGADVAHVTRRSDELVLEFPVEIEVRLVSPPDQEQLAAITINKLIAALEGLA